MRRGERKKNRSSLRLASGSETAWARWLTTTSLPPSVPYPWVLCCALEPRRPQQFGRAERQNRPRNPTPVRLCGRLHRTDCSSDQRMEPARLEQSALAERMTRDREGTACAHSAPGNNDPGSLRWGEAANMSSTHSHTHTHTHTHTPGKLPTTPVACVCVRVCMCKCVLQPTLSTSSAVPAYLYQVQCGFSLPPPLPTGINRHALRAHRSSPAN